MRIAFFGTGDFSKKILEDLITDDRIDIELVVSQPDKPVGRKREILPTPVKAVALENSLEVLQPEKLRGNEDFFTKLKDLDLDFIVVVAYGKIVPKEVLDAPKHGCINIHGSILPKYRGASPIQESIKAGDTKTGLTIMYMSEGMDEGDILSILEVDIDITDKSPDIFNKFQDKGAELLVDTLTRVLNGEIKGKKQDEDKATYCSKISKSDGEIDFSKQTSKEVYDLYRSYTPWPGIYSYYNGKKFSIEECFYIENIIELYDDFSIGDVVELESSVGILCKSGILILKQVKLEGKKSMDILSFVNGNKDFLNYSF